MSFREEILESQREIYFESLNDVKISHEDVEMIENQNAKRVSKNDDVFKDLKRKYKNK